MSRGKIRMGSPQKKVPNEGGFGFFDDFQPICRHISKTVHFRQSYYGAVIGFKVTVVLKGEYLQSDAFYRHSYYIGLNKTP